MTLAIALAMSGGNGNRTATNASQRAINQSDHNYL